MNAVESAVRPHAGGDELGAPPWFAPIERPTLGQGEVHVWKASVAGWALYEPELLSLLDASETARAARFHFARDRVQFVVAHGLVRRLLGHYAGDAPERIRFGSGPAGKPCIVSPAQSSYVQFNLSHSADVILMAVMMHSAVGVDVEQWSDDVEPVDLSSHFFSPGERQELLALGPQHRAAAFFATWARKEAYIKATGLGVSQGLGYFDVTVAADRPGRLLADRLAPNTTGSWHMIDLDVGPGYSATLVVNTAATLPRCFTLRPNAVLNRKLGTE